MSGSGASDIYSPKWIHYENLKFLKSTKTPRQSKGNLENLFFKEEVAIRKEEENTRSEKGIKVSQDKEKKMKRYSNNHNEASATDKKFETEVNQFLESLLPDLNSIHHRLEMQVKIKLYQITEEFIKNKTPAVLQKIEDAEEKTKGVSKRKNPKLMENSGE